MGFRAYGLLLLLLLLLLFVNVFLFFISAFKILSGKPTGKRPLGRPRRKWDDKIRMDLEEIGINAGNWVYSAQERDYW